MIEHGRYLGSSDEVESLRLEHSSVSPSTHEEFVQLTHSLQHALEALFAPFIPDEKREKNHELSQRVIVADNENTLLLDSFYDGSISCLEEIDTVMGVYMWPVHFVAVNQDGPGRLISLMRENGVDLSEKEQQEVVNIPASLAHEISHAYFNRYLPHLFSEAAAHYYSHHMLTSLQLPPGKMSTYYGAVLVFDELLNMHGDTLHETVFSSQCLPSDMASSLENYVISMCEEDEILAYVLDYQE